MQPEHSPLSAAFRHIKPHWRHYLDYVSISAKAGDEDMAKIIATLNALPKKERQTIMPEKLCDLAGVQAADLFSAVASTLWQAKSTESLISMAMEHPNMIQATAFYGQSHADNFRDRELMFRLTNSLPDKKGSSIVINNNNNPQNLSVDNPMSNGFRSMEQRILDMSKLLDSAPDENILDMGDKDGDLETVGVEAKEAKSVLPQNS